MEILRLKMVQLVDGRWFCPRYDVAFDTEETAQAFVKMAYTSPMYHYIDLLRESFE